MPSTNNDSSPVMAAASILAASKVGPGKGTRKDLTTDDSSMSQKSLNNTTDAETVTHEQRWETMFIRLKAYKAKHGNCLVPNRYAEDTQLGSWVSAQRRQYKIVTSGGPETAAMTPERAQKLRDIGFEWSTTNPRNVPWEQRYSELREFVSNYGHAEVPMRWEENPQLSNWVSKQRHQYKLLISSRPSRLTRERVKLLNGVFSLCAHWKLFLRDLGGQKNAPDQPHLARSIAGIGFVWEASRRRLQDGSQAGDKSEDDHERYHMPKAAARKTKKLRLAPPDPPAVGDPSSDEEGEYNMSNADYPEEASAVGADAAAQPHAAMAHALAAAANPAAGMVQANIGLWAAAAAGQTAMMPPHLNPAMAAATGAAMSPALLLPFGAMMPFGAIMQSPAAFSLAHGQQQFAAAVLPIGVANSVQQMHLQQQQYRQAMGHAGQAAASVEGRREGAQNHSGRHEGCPPGRFAS